MNALKSTLKDRQTNTLASRQNNQQHSSTHAHLLSDKAALAWLELRELGVERIT